MVHILVRRATSENTHNNNKNISFEYSSSRARSMDATNGTNVIGIPLYACNFFILVYARLICRRLITLIIIFYFTIFQIVRRRIRSYNKIKWNLLVYNICILNGCITWIKMFYYVYYYNIIAYRNDNDDSNALFWLHFSMISHIFYYFLFICWNPSHIMQVL